MYLWKSRQFESKYCVQHWPQGGENLISSVTPKCNNISDPRGIYKVVVHTKWYWTITILWEHEIEFLQDDAKIALFHKGLFLPLYYPVFTHNIRYLL